MKSFVTFLLDSVVNFFFLQQVYAKVSGEAALEEPTVDVSSKEFYGEGYDDSDKRIPDMTIINQQLGINLFLACFVYLYFFCP